MNVFEIQILACNPEDDKMVTAPVEALVNAESESTWLPGSALRAIGVRPQRKRVVNTPTKQTVERDAGHVILYANGHKTMEEVVFAEPGDAIIVGSRALEVFGIQIDEPKHGFIALTTLAAFNHKAAKVA